MRVYNPERDEALLAHWWYELLGDPEELKKLFIPTDQSLTEILLWAKNRAQISLDADDQGISMMMWCEPMMSGAFLGGWCRKSLRYSRRMPAFMYAFLAEALKHYPVLVSVTKQQQLHKFLMKMGQVYVGEIPHLYGGETARIYQMTRESRIAVQQREVAQHG